MADGLDVILWQALELLKDRNDTPGFADQLANLLERQAPDAVRALLPDQGESLIVRGRTTLRLPCLADRQRVTIGLPAGATGDARHDLSPRTGQPRIGRISLTLA